MLFSAEHMVKNAIKAILNRSFDENVLERSMTNPNPVRTQHNSCIKLRQDQIFVSNHRKIIQRFARQEIKAPSKLRIKTIPTNVRTFLRTPALLNFALPSCSFVVTKGERVKLVTN